MAQVNDTTFLHGCGLLSAFLNKDIKSTNHKEKMMNCATTNQQILLIKDTVKRVKRKATKWGKKYLSHYLIKISYLEYIDNSSIATKRTDNTIVN
jgi:hypothetical protein